MKRKIVFCTIIISVILIVCLSQTAFDPESVCGEWYSADDLSLYLFRDGLIYCSKYAVLSDESGDICGAYTFCRNSVFLFAEGIAGLDTEKELYLVNRGDGSFLCENSDGTGKTYFIRYRK